MSIEHRHDVVYNKQFKNAHEGHALYRPISSQEIRPGACGFFDSQGDWNPIVQLDDMESLKNEGWTTPQDLEVILDPVSISWKPKHSSHMSGVELNFGANVSVPGAPVGGGVQFSYKSSHGAGAVLVTKPPVKYFKLKKESCLLEWIAQNTNKLLEEWPDIKKKEYSVWIITKTYVVEKCAIGLLTEENAATGGTLNLEVMDLVSLSPSARWWSSGGDGSWSVYSHAKGVVVFMSGISFRVNFFSSKLKQQSKAKIWKDAGTSIHIPLDVPSGDLDMADIQIAQHGKLDDELEELIQGMIDEDGDDGGTTSEEE